MPPSANKKYLLLDSCIAEYCLNKDMQPKITKQLEKWAGNIFDFAISELSYAELINGAYKEKVDRVKELLDSYSRIEVSQRVLRGAGVLGNVYKAQDNRNGNINLADRIIAATSFSYNIPIVTANVKDFPYPFFKVITDEDLIYKKGSKNVLLSTCVLFPSTSVLNYWHSKTK